MQRCIGKALGQLQHLDVLVQVADGLLLPFGQQSQPVGDVLFGGQQVGQVDIGRALKHPDAEFVRFDALVQRFGQLFRRLVDEIGGRFQQLRTGQAGVAVARIVAQGAQKGGFQPLGAVPFHVVVLGDAVGVAEIQLQRLTAEQIGVGGDGIHGAGAEHPEHLHRAAGADLKLGQIGDELPHPEHPLELLLDAVGLVRRDTRDDGKLGGVVGDHFQRRRAEFIDDLVGRAGPDIGQRAAGQEGVDRFQIPGHIGLALLGMELASVGGVVLVFSPADHAFARVELAHDAADHRHRAAAGDLEHGVAVVRVLVNDVLHRAFQLFQLLLHRVLTSFRHKYL